MAYQLFTLPKQLNISSSFTLSAGAKAYFFETLTTTPQDTYSDAALTTPHQHPVVADSAGVLPPIYLDPSLQYKLTLNTSADVLIYTVDPANDQVLSASTIGAFLYPTTDSENAASVTPLDFRYPELNVFRYMTAAQIEDVLTRALTLDVRAAVQNAVNVAQQIGGTVYCPAGSYLIRRVAGLDSQFNGIHIPYTHVFNYVEHMSLRGDGRNTVFYAGDNSMTVFRLSDSRTKLSDFAIDSNSKTGITGLSLIGSDTADTTLDEHIDWNVISALDIVGCAEGIELENPSLGGCYYNTFSGVRLYNNTRHIRFRDNSDSGGCNRNVFISVAMNGGNTGVWIDGADTNRFIACSFEDIATGSSPSVTPTAIHITDVGSLFGLNSAATQFIGCVAENCTRDLNLNQRRISILGGTLGGVGTVAGTATADLFVGGDHKMQMRELELGGAGVNGLRIQPGEIAAYSAAQNTIAVSSNQAGSYPFDADSHMIVRAIPTAGKHIVFVTGTSSTPRMQLTDLGQLTMLDASITEKSVSPIYGATVNIDLNGGNNYVVTVTNGTAFTMAQPTNDKLGQKWTLTIVNSSGGAMGVITWNAAFKMSAWTNPANGQNRSITFETVAASFQREVSRTPADVPN